MAYRILQNRLGGTIVLQITSNSTIQVVGNSSVSELAVNNHPTPYGNVNEVVLDASIRRVYSLSEANVSWKIERGANLVGFVAGGHEFDLKEGLSYTLDSDATLVTTTVGGTNGVLIIELSKNSNKE